MRNAHFENDAQNWHIIGVELVSKVKDSLLTVFCIVQLEIWEKKFESSPHLFEAAKSPMARLHPPHGHTLLEAHWLLSDIRHSLQGRHQRIRFIQDQTQRKSEGT